MSTSAIQEEMSIALGHLGEKRVIADLVNLLETRKSFWKRKPETPDAVRIRAIWALGMFMPSLNNMGRRHGNPPNLFFVLRAVLTVVQ